MMSSLVTPAAAQNAAEIDASAVNCGDAIVVATVITNAAADETAPAAESDSAPNPDAMEPVSIISLSDQLNKFSLGRILATPGAIELAQIHQISLRQLLFRHAIGDWGDLCHDDQRANFEALANGSRLMSSYVIRTASPNHGANSEPTEVKFWIITEADRAATTVLLPEEY